MELAQQAFKHYRYRKEALASDLSVEERQRLALLNVGTGYILLHQLREGKFSTVWLALASQRLPLNDRKCPLAAFQLRAVGSSSPTLSFVAPLSATSSSTFSCDSCALYPSQRLYCIGLSPALGCLRSLSRTQSSLAQALTYSVTYSLPITCTCTDSLLSLLSFSLSHIYTHTNTESLSPLVGASGWLVAGLPSAAKIGQLTCVVQPTASSLWQ